MMGPLVLDGMACAALSCATSILLAETSLVCPLEGPLLCSLCTVR